MGVKFLNLNFYLNEYPFLDEKIFPSESVVAYDTTAIANASNPTLAMSTGLGIRGAGSPPGTSPTTLISISQK